MVRIFNRPCIAYLDNKKVTIYSFDTVNKITNNEFKKGDKLIFETDEETSEYLCGRISTRVKLNFKMYNCLETELLLHNIGGGSIEMNKIRTECEIQECEINSIVKLSKKEEVYEACMEFKGKFVILINDVYYIVYRKSSNKYFFKKAIMGTLERIEYYLKRDNELIGKSKISTYIDNEFLDDYNKYEGINKEVWKMLNINDEFEIIF